MPTVYLLSCKDSLGHIENIGVYSSVDVAKREFMKHLEDNEEHYGKINEIDEICFDTWVLCGVHSIEELFFIC